MSLLIRGFTLLVRNTVLEVLMKTNRQISLLVFATFISIASLSLQAAGTKDKYKSDSCQTAEGKKVACDKPAEQVAKYPNAKIVVPGHGKVGGEELLKKKKKLALEANQN